MWKCSLHYRFRQCAPERIKYIRQNNDKASCGHDLRICWHHSTKYIGPRLDEKGLTVHSNYSLLHKFLLKRYCRELCDEVLIRLSPLSVTSALCMVTTGFICKIDLLMLHHPRSCSIEHVICQCWNRFGSGFFAGLRALQVILPLNIIKKNWN